MSALLHGIRRSLFSSWPSALATLAILWLAWKLVPPFVDWALLSYSPYHRVADGVKYPAVLLTAFGNDTRVDPLHARKLCAALQYSTASTRPVLLRHEADAGHTTGGINLAADMLAFLADHTGLGR